MQKQHIRILILAIILILIICFILWRASSEMQEVDQQMPMIGCVLSSLLI